MLSGSLKPSPVDGIRADGTIRSHGSRGKFIRDGIRRISIITSCASINLADFCGRAAQRADLRRFFHGPTSAMDSRKEEKERKSLDRERHGAEISLRFLGSLRSVRYRLERRAERGIFLFAQIESHGGKPRRGIMTRRCFLRKRLIDNRSRRGEITYASERAELSRV